MPKETTPSQQQDLEGLSRVLNGETILKNPRLYRIIQVYQYWQELSATNTPSRRMIDPTALGPKILPYLVLIEIIDGGKDYIWRLFGSRHQDEFGASLKGKTLSEVIRLDPTASTFKLVLDATVENASPQFFQHFYRSRGNVFKNCYGVLLPLWDDGPHPNVILGVTEWIDVISDA